MCGSLSDLSSILGCILPYYGLLKNTTYLLIKLSKNKTIIFLFQDARHFALMGAIADKIKTQVIFMPVTINDVCYRTNPEDN